MVPAAAAGEPVVTSPVRRSIASSGSSREPVVDFEGSPSGVVVGYLDEPVG